MTEHPMNAPAGSVFDSRGEDVQEVRDADEETPEEEAAEEQAGETEADEDEEPRR